MTRHWSCFVAQAFLPVWLLSAAEIKPNGDVTWIELRLVSEGEGRTRLELEHTAHIDNERWLHLQQIPSSARPATAAGIFARVSETYRTRSASTAAGMSSCRNGMISKFAGIATEVARWK